MSKGTSWSRRLGELQLALPPAPKPVGAYVAAVRLAGNLVVTSGQLPWNGDKLLFTGKLGSEVTLDQGYHEQIRKGGGIPHDQFWREVEQSRRAKRPTPARGKKA